MDHTHTAPEVPRDERVPARYNSWSRGGGGVGVFLIIAGIVALVAQFMPGIGWERMWPAIFIVIGLSQMIIPGPHGWSGWQIIEGFGTALFGGVLLGNTTGAIDWTMWLTFISLWPAMLVAAGFGLLGKATDQAWVRVLGAFVMWGILLFSAAVGAGLIESPSLLVPWFWM